MTFITKEDFANSIRNNVLDDITDFDDNKIDDAIAFAVNYAKGYLNARYDTAAIFSATGSGRDIVVLSQCIDIAIYKLHDLINPRKTPEHRKHNYEDALLWFDNVNAGKINPPGLPLPADGSRDFIKFNGRPAQQNWLS